MNVPRRRGSYGPAAGKNQVRLPNGRAQQKSTFHSFETNVFRKTLWFTQNPHNGRSYGPDTRKNRDQTRSQTNTTQRKTRKPTKHTKKINKSVLFGERGHNLGVFADKGGVHQTVLDVRAHHLTITRKRRRKQTRTTRASEVKNCKFASKEAASRNTPHCILTEPDQQHARSWLEQPARTVEMKSRVNAHRNEHERVKREQLGIETRESPKSRTGRKTPRTNGMQMLLEYGASHSSDHLWGNTYKGEPQDMRNEQEADQAYPISYQGTLSRRRAVVSGSVHLMSCSSHHLRRNRFVAAMRKNKSWCIRGITTPTVTTSAQ